MAGNVIQAKTGTIARSNTTAKQLFTLPAQAMIIGIRTFGAGGDNASAITLASQPTGSTTKTTFATITPSTTSGAEGTAILAGAAFNRGSELVYVTGLWAEATTNTSTSGGPYSVVVEYL